MEQQLLPSAELKPFYDKVTWLFVTRNFEGDDKDREAARTHDRFGITSWPHLIVFDPRDDKLLGTMSRSLPQFKKELAAFFDAVPKPGRRDRNAAVQMRRALTSFERGDGATATRILERVARTEDGVDAWLQARELLRSWHGDRRTMTQRLADPDVRERAIAIEEIARSDGKTQPSWATAVAERLFDDEEHLVVRIRALTWLAEVAPKKVPARAETLLEVPSDAFRGVVLGVVKEHPDPELAETLARIFAGAGGEVPSNNPNVLRSKVAACLVESGDASAIDALAGMARTAQPNNGTTLAVHDALRGVATRVSKEDRRRIVALLLESFPGPEDDPAFDEKYREWIRPMIGRLARKVRETLAAVSGVKSLPPLPPSWTGAARERYLAEVTKAVERARRSS